MYIPEIKREINLNGKKDDILCANKYVSIVLGFLFITLSSVCRAHLLIVRIFHTKITQIKIHYIIIISHVVSHSLLTQTFYENIEFLDKSDGLQISVHLI